MQDGQSHIWTLSGPLSGQIWMMTTKVDFEFNKINYKSKSVDVV